MIYNVYSIRDKQTGFMSPMVDASDGSAIRNFARAVNNDGSLFDFAPTDFDLYCIGQFDDQSGTLTPVNPVRFVVSGNSMVGYRLGDAYEK